MMLQRLGGDVLLRIATGNASNSCSCHVCYFLTYFSSVSIIPATDVCLAVAVLVASFFDTVSEHETVHFVFVGDDSITSVT